ncbi:MAG: hypothetical protein HY035_09300 [Nitrospirae bacterium]|nr:hypothetical protein [Nitrospirota bacterium]
MGNTENEQTITKIKRLGLFFTNTKTKLRPIFSVLAYILPFIVAGVVIHSNFFTEPGNGDIETKFAKYETGSIVAYHGELQNKSAYHAKEFVLKGRFNSKILDSRINTSDSLEKKESNHSGSFEFSLKHLSGKNRCDFYIIVDKNSLITEKFKVSWGKKGTLELNLQEPNEYIKRGIELRERASDLSHKARQKWFEDNAKNIRK